MDSHGRLGVFCPSQPSLPQFLLRPQLYSFCLWDPVFNVWGSVSISLLVHLHCVSFFVLLAAGPLSLTCLFSLSVSLPHLLWPICSVHIPLTSASLLSSGLCPLLVSSLLCLCSSSIYLLNSHSSIFVTFSALLLPLTPVPFLCLSSFLTPLGIFCGWLYSIPSNKHL